MLIKILLSGIRSKKETTVVVSAGGARRKRVEQFSLGNLWVGVSTSGTAGKNTQPRTELMGVEGAEESLHTRPDHQKDSVFRVLLGPRVPEHKRGAPQSRLTLGNLPLMSCL